MNDQIKLSQHTIGTLFHTNKPSQMWNLIRKIKSKPVCNDGIQWKHYVITSRINSLHYLPPKVKFTVLNKELMNSIPN